MFSPYRSILSIPGVRSFVVAGLLGRFPISMLGLGSVLLVTAETGSYGIAGIVTATLALSTAFAAPVAGRLADTRGQTRILLPGLFLHTVGVVGLLAAVLSHAPTILLIPPAALAGASVPQIGSMVRTRWSALVGGTPRMSTAMSLESAMDETVFVIGPVLATVLCTTVTPSAGLIGELALALAGGLAFATQRATEPPPGERRIGDVRAFQIPGVRALVVTFMAVGSIFGAINLSMVAFTSEHGHPGAAGMVLAFFAMGSLLAGLIYGTITWKAPLGSRFLRAIVCLALGTVPVVLAPNVPVMALAGLLIGFTISPTVVAGIGLIEAMVPPSALTEGFAWVGAALGIGVALGSSIAGQVVDASGAREGLMMTTGEALLATAIAFAAAGVLARSVLARPAVEPAA
ncbi:MAG TPA: MFS transporter [Mycobacteriales bacterium]|nr:MFS transporter [Mycobacteriales bacterium]